MKTLRIIARRLGRRAYRNPNLDNLLAPVMAVLERAPWVWMNNIGVAYTDGWCLEDQLEIQKRQRGLCHIQRDLHHLAWAGSVTRVR